MIVFSRHRPLSVGPIKLRVSPLGPAHDVQAEGAADVVDVHVPDVGLGKGKHQLVAHPKVGFLPTIFRDQSASKNVPFEKTGVFQRTGASCLTS